MRSKHLVYLPLLLLLTIFSLKKSSLSLNFYMNDSISIEKDGSISNHKNPPQLQNDTKDESKADHMTSLESPLISPQENNVSIGATNANSEIGSSKWECRRKSTVMCPCPQMTSPKYQENMKNHYNIIDTSIESALDSQKPPLDIECLDLTLPLRNIDAAKCWPSLMILASFPTSGNGLTRSLLRTATGLFQTVSEYKQAGIDQFYAASNELYVRGSCAKEKSFFAPIPLAKEPVFVKTHSRNPDDKFTDNRHVSGVIRLARNPGDHIFRNRFRWQKRKLCPKEHRDCEAWEGNPVCKELLDVVHTEGYIQFHEGWNRLDKNISQTIMYYEHISMKESVFPAIQRAMTALNVSILDHDNVQDDIMNEIIEPSYEHGSFLTKMCGKRISRKINEWTKNVSEPLGYQFDWDSATWSLLMEGLV